MSQPELLVIVPSRGRPKNVARLLDAVHDTSRITTHVYVCVDDDDPELKDYEYVYDIAGQPGDILKTGSRKGLAAWTNEVAVRRAGEYQFLASLGDDHVPCTPGWDLALVRGIADMGGTGFTYPWDGTREDIPEAVVMSSNIVQALGWMCEPSLQHWYIDNVWNDLGWRAGCIRHLRAITVDHMHPAAGKAKVDETTMDSSKVIDADRAAYHDWRRTRMADDVKKILELCEQK